MAAGLGYIEFATGDILTAAVANGYLASQTVMVFADAAARTSAIASPQEGMISYLKDTNATEYYSGSAWAAIGGGSSASMTLLSSTSITNTSTINVSVASGYKKLVMYIENFAPANTQDTLLFRFNSVSSSSYDQLAYQPNYGVISLSHPATELSFGQVNNINTSSNGFLMLEIPNYDSTNSTKSGFAYMGATYGGSSSTFTTGGWFSFGSTSAISTLNLGWGTGNWKAQGTIKIYGVN